MPERVATGEIAERLHDQRAAKKESNLAVEIVEGLLLAIVAVTTAWSGYQSTLWDSRSVASYGGSSKLRIAAQGAQTTAGQQMLYDSTTFNEWTSVGVVKRPRTSKRRRRRGCVESRRLRGLESTSAPTLQASAMWGRYGCASLRCVVAPLLVVT